MRNWFDLTRVLFHDHMYTVIYAIYHWYHMIVNIFPESWNSHWWNSCLAKNCQYWFTCIYIIHNEFWRSASSPCHSSDFLLLGSKNKHNYGGEIFSGMHHFEVQCFEMHKPTINIIWWKRGRRRSPGDNDVLTWGCPPFPNLPSKGWTVLDSPTIRPGCSTVKYNYHSEVI